MYVRTYTYVHTISTQDLDHYYDYDCATDGHKFKLYKHQDDTYKLTG